VSFGVERAVLAPSDSETGLNAVDALNLLALFLLAVAAAVFRQALGPDALYLLGVIAFLTSFVLASAWLSVRHPLWRVAHDFSPALLIPVLFNSLGPIIDCASPGRWDATFSELDARLFGEFPALWRDVLGRPSWFVDAASLAYVCYYLLPVGLAVLLYRRAARSDFRCFVFTVTLTFFASYVGYFMFPTSGPRTPLPGEAQSMGGAVSDAIRAFIDFTERTRTDAFPSGHTAVALVCLYFAGRISRRGFAVVVPLVAGIVFSTIYLHYHYVVDVVAGAGLAAGSVWLGPRLVAPLEPREMMRWVSVHLGMR
jgi:membrane-associated phospholipid phosphatase